MRLDLTVHKGDKTLPVVVLIHGLGVDKFFWISPLSTRIFARNIPLRVLAAERPAENEYVKGRKVTIGTIPAQVSTLWDALIEEGCSLLCWSQRKPVGPIDSAVEELHSLMKTVDDLFPGRPVVFIGHSRGGLAARKYMEHKNPRIRALITISSPHHGSSLARLGKYLEPFSGTVKKILPENSHSLVVRTVRNVTNLVEGNALRELLPGAEFFRNLKDSRQTGTQYISFGGTEPRLVTVYIWIRKGTKRYPRQAILIPDSLITALPAFLTVDEITPGKGDGLVSAESSIMPWAAEHHMVKANHISISWHERVKDGILRTIRTL